MSLTISCPACHAQLKVKPESAGRAVRCPKCQTRIEIDAQGVAKPLPAAAKPQSAVPKPHMPATKGQPAGSKPRPMAPRTRPAPAAAPPAQVARQAPQAPPQVAPLPPANASMPGYGGAMPSYGPPPGYAPVPAPGYGAPGQPYGGPMPAAPYPVAGPVPIAAPSAPTLADLAGEFEPPKLDAGRHGAKHGTGKHHGKQRPSAATSPWLWGFTILGVVIVAGGIGYYFATQKPHETVARGKVDRNLAKVAAKIHSEEETAAAPDEAESDKPAAPASNKREKSTTSKKKSPPEKKKPANDDEDQLLTAAPEDSAPAATVPKAKEAKAPATPPTAAKPKAPAEKAAQPAIDPALANWKLEGLSQQITDSLETGILGEREEPSKGKFLVLTVSIIPKNRDKAVASLKDVTLSMDIAGRPVTGLRPVAVGNNDQGTQFFTVLRDVTPGETHMVCGAGECKLGRATDNDPVTVNVTVSPCRMSFAFHVPTPDESEFEFFFVDTVISGKTDKATAEEAKPDAADAKGLGDP